MDWLSLDGDTITMASMALGAVIWALRLESKVNVVTSKHEDLIDRLKRIESLIDRRFTQLMEKK